MTTQIPPGRFEDRLLEQLKQFVEERSVLAGARPQKRSQRRLRGRNARLLVGTVGTAVVGVVVVSITVLGATAPRALAGWTATPTTPTAGQIAAADKACRAQLTRPAVRRTPSSRTGVEPSQLQMVMAETRGPFTMILYEAEDGSAELACLDRAPLVWADGSSLTNPPAPMPAGQISVISSGGSTTPAAEGEESFRNVVGRTGAGVGGVTLTLSDGRRVTASLTDGWFLAWWPGTQQAVAAEIASASGTTTEQLSTSQ